ncbi:MAG: 3'-5' exonuclease [Elusimicrobia bacterium CG08_land_8_20_14_0_20_59_10]|nr:MAG: 3'-5' exonuclease [Elusimicrobia bacterium CG08_land_8_20_14_0_20_59_10]
MYLFFDTETTGLPKNWKAPITDLDNWPRMIQLAYLLSDGLGNRLAGGDYIIKPVGFTIPEDAAKIHGISTERALKEGKDLGDVLREFQAAVGRAERLIAHNISFDEKIVGAEFLRNGMPDSLPAKKKICTMHSSTEYCALPGPYGFKWPKLEELHRKLFRAGFDGAHNAAADIAATVKCFWELKRLGVIKG